jgi:hypothetical protein
MANLGPGLFLKDDDDVFAREPRIRKLGCAAIIYSTWDYGFSKEGETEPSWGGIIVLTLNRRWSPEEHPQIWSAANHLLGGSFDKCGRSPTTPYPPTRVAVKMRHIDVWSSKVLHSMPIA